MKDGKTYFELSPTGDRDVYDAWTRLNKAQVAAKDALNVPETLPCTCNKVSCACPEHAQVPLERASTPSTV